jgi:hypothetical protein
MYKESFGSMEKHSQSILFQMLLTIKNTISSILSHWFCSTSLNSSLIFFS